MTKHYTTTDRLMSRPFLDTQPGWSRTLYWVVGLPVTLAWIYLIATNKVNAYPLLAGILFAVSAVLGIVQTIYFRRNRQRKGNVDG